VGRDPRGGRYVPVLGLVGARWSIPGLRTTSAGCTGPRHRGARRGQAPERPPWSASARSPGRVFRGLHGHAALRRPGQARRPEPRRLENVLDAPRPGGERRAGRGGGARSATSSARSSAEPTGHGVELRRGGQHPERTEVRPRPRQHGSMKNVMAALRRAATQFTETLFANASDDLLKIAVVPYVAAVNPGPRATCRPPGSTRAPTRAGTGRRCGPHHRADVRLRPPTRSRTVVVSQPQPQPQPAPQPQPQPPPPPPPQPGSRTAAQGQGPGRLDPAPEDLGARSPWSCSGSAPPGAGHAPHRHTPRWAST
jgi:hypothetical protein